jgi:flagellar biosynthesis/type III secretory pathway protein FliH
LDSKHKRQARSPDFLANVSRKPMRALFSDADRTVTPLFGGLDGEGRADADEALGVEALAPPLPAPPPAMNPEAAARLGRAIAELEAVGARTGAEMAATALELALMVTRKIIDAELVADPGLARRLIKAAVRRLGDVHKVTVRVSPDDLEALRSGAPSEGGAAAAVASGAAGVGGGGGAGGGAANLAAELGVAKVELVADTNLTSGECIVDSDAATVDGRLGTRVEELRRVLEMAIHQESTDLRGPGGDLAS